MAITETSSSLTSGERDTGSSAAVTEEAAHLPDPTTTYDPPPETTTFTGIYTASCSRWMATKINNLSFML